MKKMRRPREELSVHVKGKNLTVTPALHDQVVNKMGRLERYHDRLHGIEVELRTEQTRAAADHNCVEATTHVGGKTIRVASTHEDMFAAIDEAVDKLYRQLNRQKERLKSHHPSKSQPALTDQIDHEGSGSEVPTEPSSPAIQDEGTITHRETLLVEPQFEEDAIQDMEALGHDFFVFLNARNERMSVLYRRRDGAYGLIEPHIAR